LCICHREERCDAAIPLDPRRRTEIAASQCDDNGRGLAAAIFIRGGPAAGRRL